MLSGLGTARFCITYVPEGSLGCCLETTLNALPASMRYANNLLLEKAQLGMLQGTYRGSLCFEEAPGLYESLQDAILLCLMLYLVMIYSRTHL